VPGTNAYNDILFVDSDGITHYVKLVITRTSGEQEDAAQAIITIHDETKSRELENMKVDFVSMAAHELRTPLAAIRGYLELIAFKMGAEVPEEVRKYMDQSLKSTTELGGLIANLLDVTRIERGNMTLHFAKVDLAADLKQAIHNAEFNAKEKQITLAYHGPEDGCPIIADQIGIHEVINNLLNNAIKYTEPGGFVHVALQRHHHHYAVNVKDSGIGIPKSALPHLFTKFYRVHGGLNSGSTGTGIGLFITKSIIEKHGGSITVESEAGAGSVFTFTLPLPDDQKLAELEKANQAGITSTRRRRGWTTQNIAR
jgi:signal transduction histidine kinase